MRGPDPVKRGIKRALARSGAMRLAGRLKPPLAVILRYHAVPENPEQYDHSLGSGLTHPRRLFAAQMRLVAREYQPVTVADLASARAGGKRIPRRAVAITFDDGFADNYEVAAPVLEENGLKGAFYVTVGSIEAEHPPWFIRLRYAFRSSRHPAWDAGEGGPAFPLSAPEERRRAMAMACGAVARLTGSEQERKVGEIERDLGMAPFVPGRPMMMSWAQIRELHRAGHVIGSHSLSHPNLAFVDAARARAELEGARERLSRELDAPVEHFAYPSPILEPHFTAETTALVRESGYATAVTCRPGPVGPNDDLLQLRRAVVPMDLEEFRWVLEATLAGRVV